MKKIFKDVKIGDSIELLNISNFITLRHNDKISSEIKNIFLSAQYVNVVEKTKSYILISYHDSESYPNDNYYVIKLFDGDFIIRKHCENTKRGAIYYKEDYFGYVGEDENYVYLAHYSIYEDGKDAMRKVKKDEYYKFAVSINEFDYADEHYKKEWGLIGREIK